MTIIIPTCKRSNLEPCLDSVRKYSSDSVLVVANGFDDREWLESTGVKFLWFDERIGYTKAINAGIRSTTDDVILLNDDVIIFPQEKDEWTNALKQFDYSGSKMLVCDVTGKPFLLFFCVCIKRTVLDKVGLPDEIFNPGFGEDIDYAWRVEAAGYQQHLVSMNIYHEGEKTVHTLPNWNSIIERNKKVLYERYGNKPTLRFEKIRDSFSSQDEKVYKEIYISNSYQINFSEVKGKVVFDFGSNVGMFSLFVLELGAKEVVSVEANPKTYKSLIENVKDFPEIKPLNKAIYHLDNENVKISEAGTGSTIAKEGYDVTTITLETLANQYPDEKDMVLKLDCEGAEYNVIFNTTREVVRRFKTISCEVHTEVNLDENYRGKKIFNDRMDFLGYRNLSDQQIYYWDVVIATGERVNMRPLPYVIQKWIRDDEKPLAEKFIQPDVKLQTPVNIQPSSSKRSVTAVIPTNGRYYSTLPLAIQSIIFQTRPPERLVIFDDNDNPIDLRSLSVYKYLFSMLDDKKIQWSVVFGRKMGAHFNHQTSQEMAENLVYRLDDDEIASPNVLEILLSNMVDGVGAVGGLVLLPGADYRDCGNNSINDLSDNCQWHRWEGKKEVQHLYSSFLYRKGIANYELSLSKACHREETIFSYRIYLKGYKLIVDSSAVTIHMRNPEGGIRTLNHEMFDHDEKLFQEIKRDWNGEIVCYLDNGKGDHVVFKSILPEIKSRYKKVTIACCYPDLFEGENLISLEEGKNLVTPDRFNIYKFMADRNWNTELVNAFRKMYLE